MIPLISPTPSALEVLKRARIDLIEDAALPPGFDALSHLEDAKRQPVKSRGGCDSNRVEVRSMHVLAR